MVTKRRARYYSVCARKRHAPFYTRAGADMRAGDINGFQKAAQLFMPRGVFFVFAFCGRTAWGGDMARSGAGRRVFYPRGVLRSFAELFYQRFDGAFFFVRQAAVCGYEFALAGCRSVCRVTVGEK